MAQSKVEGIRDVGVGEVGEGPEEPRSGDGVGRQIEQKAAQWEIGNVDDDHVMAIQGRDVEPVAAGELRALAPKDCTVEWGMADDDRRQASPLAGVNA